MALYRLPGENTTRNRMLFFLVLLVGAIAGMVSTYTHTETIQPFPSPSEQEMIQADPLAGVSPLDAIQANENLYHTVNEVASEVERSPREARTLQNYTETIEHVFSWLKGHSNEQLAALARPRDQWHIQKILREPPRWRGEVLHVFGQLASVSTLDFPSNPPGLRKLFLLRLRDDRLASYYTILTPEMPKKTAVYRDKTPTEPGEWGSPLGADAFYLLHLTWNSEGEGIKHTPLLIARRVYLANEGQTPPLQIDERDDPGISYHPIKPNRTTATFDDEFVKNLTVDPTGSGPRIRGLRGASMIALARDLKAERDAYIHAFEYLWGLSETDAHTPNPAVTYNSMMRSQKTPDWMRGQMTVFRGVIQDVYPIRLPNHPSGITRMYRLVGIENRRLHGQDYPWTIIAANLPEGLHSKHEVEAHGIFIKRYPLKEKKGTSLLTPLIVVREIKITDDLSAGTKPLGWGWVALMGLGLLVLVLVIRSATRRDDAALDHLRKRSRQATLSHQKQKTGAATVTPPPTAPPSSPEADSVGSETGDAGPDSTDGPPPSPTEAPEDSPPSQTPG